MTRELATSNDRHSDLAEIRLEFANLKHDILWCVVPLLLGEMMLTAGMGMAILLRMG